MERPILIFGMPRSGTTWLGKLFDSHPDTLYRHEPDSWRLLSMPRYPDAADSARYASELRSFVDDMPEMNALRVAGKRPLFPKAYLSRGHARMIEGAAWLARLGSRFNPDFPVLMHSAAANYPERRLVWKSIESLGRMGVILDVLPEARGIHILRHPCGYIASVLRGLRGHRFSDNTYEDYGIFGATIDTSLGDSYGLTHEALAALTPEERFAWRWVLTNEKALRESEASARMLCIRYEDVCHEPMARVEQMFEFTGLKMSEQTRAFVASSTARTDAGYYSVYKNPLAAASRWQQELDPGTIERIMAIVRRSRFADQYCADPLNPRVAS